MILKKVSQIFEKFLKILDNFLQKFEFRAVQKSANLVDLEKCCKMIIYLQRSALIQPKTSLGKSDATQRRPMAYPLAAPRVNQAAFLQTHAAPPAGHRHEHNPNYHIGGRQGPPIPEGPQLSCI